MTVSGGEDKHGSVRQERYCDRQRPWHWSVFIVRRFAVAGADVVINYVRSVDQAQSVAAEVQALGRQALVVQADVSQRTQVEAMLAQALQTFGKVDILVSNAGIIIDKPFVNRPTTTGMRRSKRTCTAFLTAVVWSYRT